MTPHTTREGWLTDAAGRLSFTLRLAAGLTLPAVKVSCGWPSHGALGTGRRVIGECWPRDTFQTHAASVFVSPLLSDPVTVLGTLLHELVHASLPGGTGHKAPFKRACDALGFTGKPTRNVPGPVLAAQLADLASRLGAYPHEPIDRNLRAKQPTRLRLWECSCGIKARVASDDFRATCDKCSEPFVLQTKGEGE